MSASVGLQGSREIGDPPQVKLLDNPAALPQWRESFRQGRIAPCRCIDEEVTIMEVPWKNVADLSTPPDIVAVMAISPHEGDHVNLSQIFSRSRWQLYEVRTCQEAIRFLSKKLVGVVICESDLPDGSWKDVLETVSRINDAPLLIVTSTHADDALWSEVLNLGAYDVLVKPFERVEVTRIISLAWLQWKEQLAERARETAGKAADTRTPDVQMTLGVE